MCSEYFEITGYGNKKSTDDWDDAPKSSNNQKTNGKRYSSTDDWNEQPQAKKQQSNGNLCALDVNDYHRIIVRSRQ